MRTLAQKAPEKAPVKSGVARRAPAEQISAESTAHRLQRTIGNQALQRMLQGHKDDVSAGRPAHSGPEADPMPARANASVEAPALCGEGGSAPMAGKEIAASASVAKDKTMIDSVSSSPKLTKKTVGGPTSGPCGNFRWDIQWELSEKTSKGGLIVQKVTAAFDDVKDCKGNPYLVPKPYDPNNFPYWEAWVISKGEKVTGLSGYDDKYEWPFKIQATNGTYTIKGEAQFYEGAQLAKTNLKVTGQGPAADLPMSKTDPGLKGGTGSIAHNVKTSWECCAGGKSQTGNTKVETA